MTREEVFALATDDYQHRDGDYPKSNVATNIEVYEKSGGNFSITADFKNTSEARARRWFENFVDRNGLKIVSSAEAWQTGDYHNDWVCAGVIVSIGE